MKRTLTPKQVARALGVSESSLKRWCDKGLLATVKTAGGHRRLQAEGVMQFVRESGTRLVEPEVLGLPPTTGHGELVIDRSVGLMKSALVAGDEELCRRVVFDLYLARHRATDICDLVLAEAFHQIGDLWQCGDIEVYQERRACEICLRVLYELRSVLPPVQRTADYALGGTIEGDPYKIPTTMVEIALRENGWRAESYGSSLPAETLCAALEQQRPKLFWLSVSYVESVDQFLDRYATVYATASAAGIPVAVGGKALTEPVRQRMRFTAYCDSLRHLIDFAARVGSARPAPGPTPPGAAPAD